LIVLVAPGVAAPVGVPVAMSVAVALAVPAVLVAAGVVAGLELPQAAAKVRTATAPRRLSHPRGRHGPPP
jgi:hypothetical protein